MWFWEGCPRPQSPGYDETEAEDHLIQSPTHTQGEKPEPAPQRRLPPCLGHHASPRGPGRVPPGVSPRPSPSPVPSPPRTIGSASDGVLAVRTTGPPRREYPLMEVGQVVQVVGPPTSAHGSEGAYCIPVRVQGSEHRALLDSGAMQSLIRQALVMAPWVTIRCMHGDEHSYPIVSFEINLQGPTHIIKAAVSTRLLHPQIFQQVVKDLMGMRS